MMAPESPATRIQEARELVDRALGALSNLDLPPDLAAFVTVTSADLERSARSLRNIGKLAERHR